MVDVVLYAPAAFAQRVAVIVELSLRWLATADVATQFHLGHGGGPIGSLPSAHACKTACNRL